MTKIKFFSTKEDEKVILEILLRAKKSEGLRSVDSLQLNMTISAVHNNGNKLNLERLLNAPDGDFYYDICGMIAHIDTGTGKLKNFFVPRCSASEEA